MGVQIDLIVPPIILGLLVIMVFRVNAFIMETSIDNRLNNDMQTFAETAATVIQEEIRTFRSYVEPENYFINNRSDSIKFLNLNCITITIKQDEKNIIIDHYNEETDESETQVYSLNLSELEFERRSSTNPPTGFDILQFKLETESQPEHHARFRKETQTVKAFEERSVLLRNVAAQAIMDPCDS